MNVASQTKSTALVVPFHTDDAKGFGPTDATALLGPLIILRRLKPRPLHSVSKTPILKQFPMDRILTKKFHCSLRTVFYFLA